MSNPNFGHWFANRHYPWLQFMLLPDKELCRCARCGTQEEFAVGYSPYGGYAAPGSDGFIPRHCKCVDAVQIVDEIKAGAA